jgi:hypothetical protein
MEPVLLNRGIRDDKKRSEDGCSLRSFDIAQDSDPRNSRRHLRLSVSIKIPSSLLKGVSLFLKLILSDLVFIFSVKKISLMK